MALECRLWIDVAGTISPIETGRATSSPGQVRCYLNRGSFKSFALNLTNSPLLASQGKNAMSLISLSCAWMVATHVTAPSACSLCSCCSLTSALSQADWSLGRASTCTWPVDVPSARCMRFGCQARQFTSGNSGEPSGGGWNIPPAVETRPNSPTWTLFSAGSTRRSRT